MLPPICGLTYDHTIIDEREVHDDIKQRAHWINKTGSQINHYTLTSVDAHNTPIIILLDNSNVIPLSRLQQIIYVL
jgi:adenylosuccinate lyase